MASQHSAFDMVSWLRNNSPPTPLSGNSQHHIPKRTRPRKSLWLSEEEEDMILCVRKIYDEPENRVALSILFGRSPHPDANEFDKQAYEDLTTILKKELGHMRNS